MTNLYDFLRRIADEVKHGESHIFIRQEEVTWLNQYLQSPEHELHFKARQVGYDEIKKEPIMALDLAVGGDGLEIMAMICEAMVQNFQIADIVLKAASFYRDHIPTCPECQKRHFGLNTPAKDWTFTPHKKQ